jgi:ADP-ribosylglycohydrolase
MLTEIQIDKIKGVFFGQAIGDALGLGTEFMTKEQVLSYYPKKLKEYSQILQDGHRSRWKKGSWTDDTDQFLCICDSILQEFDVSEIKFAEELYKWYQENALGIGYTVLNVVKTPQFTLKPHKAAEMYWRMKQRKVASNGAIMRTSILGLFDFWDKENVINNTEKICKVTHWDPRCVGSCVIVSLLISELILSQKELSKSEIIKISENYSQDITEFIELSFSKQIETLKLDDPDSIGYTLKALSSGLWVHFNSDSFENGIIDVINEGGDADTNAAIAGSILGAKYGYKNIPTNLIDNLLDNSFLHEKFEKFLSLIQARNTQVII